MTMVLTKTEVDLKSLDSEELDRLLAHPRPETFTLLLDARQKRFHIGMFAYLIRSEDGEQLDERSFSAKRRTTIRKLLDWAGQNILSGDLSLPTLEGQIRKIITTFNWYDENGYAEFTEQAELAATAYRAYTKYLQSKIRLGELQPPYASAHQRVAERCLFWLFPEFNPSLLQGCARIKARSGESQPTPVADDDDLKRALALSEALFVNLSDAVLNVTPYPFQLELPNETCWVLPCKQWIRPKFRRDESNTQPNWTWDYETGRINNIQFIQSKYNNPLGDAKKMLQRANKALQEGNNNPFHRSRIGLASWALKAFAFLFCNNAACNRKAFLSQAWSSDWEPTKEEGIPFPKKKGIRLTTIKSRANRFVTFTITETFLPHFKKYLKLREFLLNGKDFEYLFFDFDKNLNIKSPSPLFLQTYFDLARAQLDPNLENLSTRTIRATKGNWAQNNYPPEIASELLQNNIETAQKSYASGNETKQALEITSFYEAVSTRNNIIATDRGIKHTALPNGGCKNHSNPKSIHPEAPVEPNCNDLNSCLWCEHFVLHADEEDAHKLHSLIYVFIKLGENSTKEILTKVITPTIEAAKLFLDKIKNHSPESAASTQKAEARVADGYLSDYWLAKLDLLLDLGVIK